MSYRFADDFDLSDCPVLNQAGRFEFRLVYPAQIFFDSCDGIEDVPEINAVILFHTLPAFPLISVRADKDRWRPPSANPLCGPTPRKVRAPIAPRQANSSVWRNGRSDRYRFSFWLPRVPSSQRCRPSKP